MEYDIILADDAYNPRTKGKLKKFLTKLLGETRFYALGNGNTFTGFTTDSLTEDEVKKIQEHLATYPNKATIEAF